MKEIPVMVLAFGNEPVKMVASIQQDKIEVRRPSSDIWTGYNRRYIFKFDQELFDQLQNAYQANDTVLLNKLWQKANRLIK